jgi:type IV secretory pathway VirB9-like protein
MRVPLLLTALLVGALPYAAGAQVPPDRADWMKKSAAAVTPAAVPHDPEQEPTGIREVLWTGRQQLIPLANKLRYTTVLVLPEDDEIMDVVCGDTVFWQVDSFRSEPTLTARNIVHVKPSKAGAETNLNVVTAKGIVYSFALHEGAKVPDFKVYLTVPESHKATTKKYVDVAQLDDVRGELLVAKEQAETERRRAAEQIATFKRQYPTTLRFDYQPWTAKAPFNVRAIWRADGFTYLKTDAKEIPALYEVKDGQPSVVNFQVENGIYVVPKEVDHGYLALGKERFYFNAQP